MRILVNYFGVTMLTERPDVASCILFKRHWFRLSCIWFSSVPVGKFLPGYICSLLYPFELVFHELYHSTLRNVDVWVEQRKNVSEDTGYVPPLPFTFLSVCDWQSFYLAMLNYPRHYKPQNPAPSFGCPETEIVVQESFKRATSWFIINIQPLTRRYAFG